MRRIRFAAALLLVTTVTSGAARAQTPSPSAPAAETGPTTAPASPSPAAVAASQEGAVAPSEATPVTAAARPATPPAAANSGIRPPSDYVIGVDDQLDIIYWQDKDMSASVVVRPDGNISLPLVNDVQAAGRTPEDLRAEVAKAATKFVEDPTVSVVVKAINSRKVFITGQVAKPGPYPLMDATSVLQMLAIAGGPSEYAKTDKISIVRRENGKDTLLKFNYKNVSQGKSLEQNITLKPGDTIIVP